MDGFDKIELMPKNAQSASDAGQGRTVRVEKELSGNSGENNPSSSAGGQDFSKSNGASGTFMSRRKKRTKFKMTKKHSIALSVVALILLMIGIPSYLTYKAGLKTYRQAKLVSAALKSQNIELASTE